MLAIQCVGNRNSLTRRLGGKWQDKHGEKAAKRHCSKSAAVKGFGRLTRGYDFAVHDLVLLFNMMELL
jgi:hypothetical protein